MGSNLRSARAKSSPSSDPTGSKIDTQPHDFRDCACAQRLDSFDGADVSREKPAAIVARGSFKCRKAAHLPQSVGAREPDLGSYVGLANAAPRTRADLFDFPRLYERRAQRAGYIIRWRAADARHRARTDGGAKLIILDEPSLGLSPLLVEELFALVKRINSRRLGSAVEQNVV